MAAKKKVVIQLPGISGADFSEDRCDIEFETLAHTGAEVIEVTEYKTEQFHRSSPRRQRHSDIMGKTVACQDNLRNEEP